MKKLFTILFLSLAVAGSAQLKFSDLQLYTGNMNGAYAAGYVGSANRKFDMSTFMRFQDSSMYATMFKYKADSSLWRSLLAAKLNITDTGVLSARLTSAVNAILALQNAGFITSSGSYTNPSWIVSLPYSKISSPPTIPAQFNPIAGTNVTLTGTYPNITISASGSGGSATDTTPLNSRLNTAVTAINNLQTGKVNISDTGAMLSVYLRKVDTAAMLSPYAKSANVTAQLALKVNISDTASMLSPYEKTANVNAKLALKADASALATTNSNVALKKDASDSTAATGYATRGKVKMDSLVLQNQINANTTAIATNTSNIATNTNSIGTLSGLTTTAKSNLVAAVNEVKATVATGSTINAKSPLYALNDSTLALLTGDNRIAATASSSAITINADTTEQYNVTALAANLTINAPTGTNIRDGQRLYIRIYSTGSYTLTWNAIFRASSDFALPTSLASGKEYYLESRYNARASKWDVVGLTTF